MYFLQDIRARLRCPEVRLLFDALGYPPELRRQKTEAILAEYEMHSDDSLYGLLDRNRLTALAGVRWHGDRQAELRHIVVHPDMRGLGLGRALIHGLVEKPPIERLTTETDGDAVGFYRKLGFRIESLGFKYPGTERFLCVLNVRQG